MPVELSQKLLLLLDPERVREYALRAGWKPVQGVKRPIIVLNHPDDGLIQVQIPLAGNDRDRACLMKETVLELATAEKRPPHEVLDELTMTPSRGPALGA
jgi:hypothetical protein